MADIWSSIFGAVGDIYANNQANNRQEAQNQTQTDIAAANNSNTTQAASLWQQQQNLGNQTWAQNQNQNAMNRAGIGTNSGSFGTATRSQNADGSWTTNNILNSGDQATLNTLRGNALEGANALDMSGQYNVNGDYAKNYDALNRPALEQNQDAQRARAAAMGMGWGSGAANNTLTGQLNDEQTRFGMATQNAGHDAWLQDQANVRSNLTSGEAGMSGISNRQAATPEWAPYATVNAPQSAIVNKGDINQNAGWGNVVTGTGSTGGTGWSGGTVGSSGTAGADGRYAEQPYGGAGSTGAGWAGGSLNGSTANGGNYDNSHQRAWDAAQRPDVTYDENGNPQSLGQAFANAGTDLSGLYNGWLDNLDANSNGIAGTIARVLMPSGFTLANAANNNLNSQGSFFDQTRYDNVAGSGQYTGDYRPGTTTYTPYSPPAPTPVAPAPAPVAPTPVVTNPYYTPVSSPAPVINRSTSGSNYSSNGSVSTGGMSGGTGGAF